MSFMFKKAIREQVGLLIGLAGGTGAGKTFSALRLASGICGDKPFAFIDTEARRSLHYADQFKFDHAELAAPFTPQAYAEAILAADTAKYPCIVVDSMSHEWASEGGVLEMQEAELDRMAGQDYAKREACRMAAWIKPKMAHKKMVQRLLQVRAHLILCFRAEEKIEMVRDEKTKKMVIVPKVSLTGINGWIPVCEKNLPFELTASFLLTADAPGMPKPIKLQEQHKSMFPLNKPINEKSGQLVTAWAAGGTTSSLTLDEVEAMVNSMDVKTIKELEVAFGTAYTRAKKLKDDKTMKRLKAVYDSQCQALTPKGLAALRDPNAGEGEVW